MICAMQAYKLTENGQQAQSDLVVEQIRSDQIQFIVIGHVAVELQRRQTTFTVLLWVSIQRRTVIIGRTSC